MLKIIWFLNKKLFMFNLKKSSNKPKSNEAIGEFNLIGVGSFIEGNIKTNGDIRIDGMVHGNVASKAKLVQGSSGKIDGEIFAQNGDFQGLVNGNVKIVDVLYLKSTAVVNGDIITGKLIIESGAVFNGKCQMKGGITKMEIESRQTPNDNAKAKSAQAS